MTRRVSSSRAATSSAASDDVDDGRGGEERQIQRRAAAAAPARAAPAVTETSEITSAERIVPSSEPAENPEHGDEQRAQSQVRADGRRRGALRFEVEQLASVVPHVADDGQQQPEQREQQRDAAVPARVSSAPRASGSACSRESVSACDCTCSSSNGARASAAAVAACCSFGTVSQSSSVVPSPPERVSRIVAAVSAVGDDGVADDGREAVDRADDARRDLLALDLERDDPARPCRCDDARRREDAQRDAVGRLDGPERADPVGRQDDSRAAPARRRRRRSRSSA